MKKKKKSAAGTILIVLLMVIAIGVLGYSGYRLLRIREGYQKAQNLYEDIQNSVAKDEEYPVEDPKEVTGTENPARRYTSLSWDYPALLALCDDAQGYIYQKDTPVSYPIVQAKDNQKYLRTMLNGEYNIAGTIFVDYRCQGGLNSPYAVIYGHNMDDKSMFGSITAYKDEAYYKAHPEFEIYAGEECYSYKVFSAFQPDIYDETVFHYDPWEDDEAFLKDMQEIKSRCPYETDAPEITKDSQICVLSTCIDYPRDYNYRYVVFLVRDEKLINRKYR